jgi:hypothetical protein
MTEEWNNVAIATVKHHFLSLCILIFQKSKCFVSVQNNIKNLLNFQIYQYYSSWYP